MLLNGWSGWNQCHYRNVRCQRARLRNKKHSQQAVTILRLTNHESMRLIVSIYTKQFRIACLIGWSGLLFTYSQVQVNNEWMTSSRSSAALMYENPCHVPPWSRGAQSRTRGLASSSHRVTVAARPGEVWLHRSTAAHTWCVRGEWYRDLIHTP